MLPFHLGPFGRSIEIGEDMAATKWEYCFLSGNKVIVPTPQNTIREVDHFESLKRTGVHFNLMPLVIMGLLGEEGWELSGAMGSGHIFKRPKE
jgi:hypothetical protein